METILAATDFSQPATNAAQYAAQLCKQLKARYLVLYHAYKLLPISRENPESMMLSQEKMQECMEVFLSELRESLLPLAPENTLILTKADSRPLETGLANLVETCEAKLIIIGSERDVLKKLLVGSSTKKLMKTTHSPILVVPPQAKFKAIRKIVMGCDLKNVADTVPIAKLIQLIKSFQAQLMVVNVGKNAKVPLDDREAYEQHTFYDLFEELDPSIQYIEGNDVSKGLLDYADQFDAQMIVVVAKQHSLLERITGTSVSKELAASAELPVLIVRK